MDGKINNCMQIAYIRRYTLTDGKESGLKVIEINNGKIRFLLNESKALDIMQLWHQGVNVSYVSKNGFTSGNGAFLKRFEGGMLYTCGLDNIGDRDGYEMHGMLHNIPARVYECYVSDKDIIVKAEMEDTELFGKNLLLRRTIKTDILSNTLTLHDELINRGTKDEQYCILYHVNVGYPMLDEGVAIIDTTENIVPRTLYAEEKIAWRTKFPNCMENEQEVCYFLEHTISQIKVVNERIGKSLVLSYSFETLPCFVQWCSVSNGDYALGLEPSTTELDERFQYRTIKAMETIHFNLSITIENNKENI